MKNFKQPGKMLKVAAGGPTGGVVSGQLCQYGDIVGVAANTVAAGAAKPSHEISTLGVYAVTKEAALAITFGAKVYAAFTNNKADPVNVTASARVFVGWAAKAALAADPTVELLMPLGGFADM